MTELADLDLDEMAADLARDPSPFRFRDAQAKADALREWTKTRRSGVNSDDWPALRVRLLERDLDLLGDPVPRGELAESSPYFERLWGRVADLLAVAA